MKTLTHRPTAKHLLMLLTAIVSISFTLSLALGAAAVAEPQDPLGGHDGSGSHTFITDQVEINEVYYSQLNCGAVVTFDDVQGGESPGTNYDVVLESNGTSLAECFVGQTRVYSVNFDILVDEPSNPLTLSVGNPNENLTIYHFEGSNSQVLVGNGPLGYPVFDALGEGSIAILFDYDQSEFGFELNGCNDGRATVEFFRRDGTLIDRIVLASLSNGSFGFQRVDGVFDIAGVSIQNTDYSGLAFDNFCHDVEAAGDLPPVCDAGGPYGGDAGVPVQFDGTGSFDSDGTIVSYQWDFGDGTSGTGLNPTHIYAEDGVYVVTLCVTDDEDLTSCCSPDMAVPTEKTSWSTLKSMYR